VGGSLWHQEVERLLEMNYEFEQIHRHLKVLRYRVGKLQTEIT